jgi:hypothetical protein
VVHQVWKEAGLKPHRIERYLASDDPDFESKAADIIGEDLPPATVANAEELPGLEQDRHLQTFPWKVGQLPLIVAMDSARSRSKRRAGRDAATTTQLHLDRPILRVNTD